MNQLLLRTRALALTSALCAATTVRLEAQTAPAASTLDSQNDQPVIELSPFTVEATEDEGYQAKATLAGTRIRTELRDVGSAISVVTPKFLQDTNSKSSADLLVYTTGTEVAGQGGNFAGGGDGPHLTSSFDQPVANTRVRGLAAADNLRDFFLTDIPWDSYNTGRVDLQRGANSILFGIGSPAGIINNSINGASFKDANKAEFQFGSYGSYRGTVDLNKVILKNELSIRLSGLYDDTKYRQDPAYRDDHRLFGALRYDPAFFNKNGAHTSFRANYERGKIKGENPALTPPIDAITPWFTAMNKTTIPWQNSQDLISATNQPNNPWIGTTNGIFDGPIVPFADPKSSAQGPMFAGDTVTYPATTDATRNDSNNGRYLGVVTYDQYAINAKMPGYALGPYKPKSLTDSSIFDFYNHLIDGPNHKNWTDFRAYNLNLSQTFFNNKLGLELAYDNQDTKWGYTNLLRDGYGTVSVDMMSTFMDGSPNPNVGRAVIVGRGTAGSGRTERKRESIRGTAYGELDFRDVIDANSALAHILGRHTFTFSQAQQSANTINATWDNFYAGSGYLPGTGTDATNSRRDVTTFSYLSGDLRGTTGPAGLNLASVSATQVPSDGTLVNWDTVSKSYIQYAVPVVRANDGTFGYDDLPYSDAYRHKDVIDSTTFVWQGYFFDGSIVPTIGWRRDIADALDAGPPNKVAGLVTNFADPEWRLPLSLADATNGRRYASVKGQTHSFSIVGHVPTKWLKNIPGGWGLGAFYNRSQNFQPDASRIDVVGDAVPSPTGKTRDYGIMISALDERVVLKINKYKTSVSDTTLSTEMGGGWAVGYVEAWGQQFAKNPGNQVWGVTSAGSKYGAGHQLWWQPADAGNHVVPNDNGSAYTQAAIDQQFDIQQAAIDDWLKPEHQISAKMQAAWGMTNYATGGGSISNPLVRLTGDTISEGTEYELTARPISGLEISINASKTDARRTDIAKTFQDWIAKRTADFNGPMGDIRFWGGGNFALAEGSNATVRDFWKYTLLSGYSLAQALNNSSVPELRPWRANFTANYDFRDGMLKGANLGGSYRWQDKQVTGFPLNGTNDGYDVKHPFFGPTNSAFDLWLGYQRPIGHALKWRVQLNVRNVFATKKLIPITVQPDGSPAAYRIPEPRVLSLTNTLEF